MEFLAKRALFIASKQYYCTGRRIFHYSSGIIRLSRACFYKTAYERSDQGIIKERGHDEETSENYERASRHDDHNDSNVENISGVAGFAADTATRGAVGAARVAENLGEMAKETAMDKAWDSAKNATRDVHDTVVAAADENVLDTTEYRTIMDLNNYSVEADDQNHIN